MNAALFTPPEVRVAQPARARPRAARDVDVQALAADLARAVGGEVRFDDGSRAQYSTDASNYRQVPLGVVLPRDTDDVEATVAVCREHGAPVLPRGGGTSLAGQCCNVAVVVDCSKYLNQVVEVDPDARLAVVEPGTVLDEVRRATEPLGLTFAPDPSTHTHCTLGGMIGNNSCGVHSMMSGRTSDNIRSLDVLTYDGTRLQLGPTPDDELDRLADRHDRVGEIYRGMREICDRYADEIRARFPDIPRRVSGYALEQLLPEHGPHLGRALVGSEGTCATVLEATLELVPDPPARALVVLGYDDVYAAADRVPALRQHGPVGLEGMDEVLVDSMRRKGLLLSHLRYLPSGRGWLLVELGGDDEDEVRSAADRLLADGEVTKHTVDHVVHLDPEAATRVWEIREAGLGATARVPGEADTWPGWEDSAVPVEHLGQYLRELHGLYDRYGYHAALYGHFGQGCVHTRINFDLATAEGIERWKAFLVDAADAVLRHGGSLSGEHGDGQARGWLLERMYGSELVGAFREFKSVWDPDWRMNPGKVVDPDPVDANMRLGRDYEPVKVQTRFSFAEDGGFARAALRCVGVGKCRRTESGIMCPSYQATREEEHSTRGRARLLFEMLNGDELADRWRNDHVKDALDLCLACKGCKGECPVNVDMATYKAEFLSHYFAGRPWRRPAAAYSMGLIMVWARLASRVPGLVNRLAGAPGISRVMKQVAGLAPERDIPQFADRTFRSWFASRPARGDGHRGEVVLWPDTFNDYLTPEVARAGVEVLEAAGFRVRIPAKKLCCGRPLYDFGMLGQAKRRLVRIIEELRPDLRAGTPIVVLEPSCAAVFRDELTNFFPSDPDARRLHDQTMVLSELLQDRAPDWEMPTLDSHALVQPHCHHASVLGFQHDGEVLDRIGLDAEVLDSGCCGMAGSFGFERGEHYEVSMQCGERVLLPAVRDAGASSLVLADGFSCREQIRQGTSREARHLAEVIAMAIGDGRGSEDSR